MKLRQNVTVYFSVKQASGRRPHWFLDIGYWMFMDIPADGMQVMRIKEPASGIGQVMAKSQACLQRQLNRIYSSLGKENTQIPQRSPQA